MNDEELVNLRNVLRSDYGFETVLCILNKLGAFESGINRTTAAKEDYLTLGKREKGAWLLDCVYKADKQKFLDVLDKGKEK